MKKLSTLFLIIVNLLVFPLTLCAEEVTFDFTSASIRENIGTSITDTKGFIYNEIFTNNNVTLQITAGSAPSRIYVDASRGQNLVLYKDYATLTFKAPSDYAITKIEFTAAGNSNINNFSASSGTISGMNWSGNAEGVRFRQGGTSYLAKAKVILTAKTAETSTFPTITYTECANIAEFVTLENGTNAKVRLTDAEVTGISADGYSTVFIQDATGGSLIQYTTLNTKLQEKTKVNGFLYVAKRYGNHNPQMKETEDTPNSTIESAPITEYTAIEGTVAEVNVAANLNKVVKVTGANFVATSATQGTLTQGEATLIVNNGSATANAQLHKITDTWVKDETALEDVTIVGILVHSNGSETENHLLPISMSGTSTGIQTIQQERPADGGIYYNLSGQRVEHPTKGLYIHNGKKVVIK